MKLPKSSTDPAYKKLLALREEAPESVWQPVWRAMCLADLWFLSRYVLSTKRRKYIAEDHPWIFARFREIQSAPDFHMDIWSREHYKSTAITHCLTIFDILRNPEITVGIFSHARSHSKDGMSNIKEEFETNEELKALFPDILYQDPANESPLWTTDRGFVVKRTSIRKEATVEGWSLEALPVGKHFGVMVFDDCVTKESCNTDEQLKKTRDWYANAVHLSSEGGKVRMAGTRYHPLDLYNDLIAAKALKLRRYVYHDEAGNSVLFSDEYLKIKRSGTTAEDWAAQMECDPLALRTDGFEVGWLKYYRNAPHAEAVGKNVFILVDPAHSRKERDKKAGDFTVFAVIGLGADANYYLLDMVRDRLSLTDRTDTLFNLVRTWRPMFVGYERYGAQSDIQHIEGEMERMRHRFEIIELKGRVAKEERIKRLIPIVEQGRFYLPEDLFYRTVTGDTRDLVKDFINEELVHFPLSRHDDMLDCISRILDPDFPAIFPNAADQLRLERLRQEDPYAAAFREAEEKRHTGYDWQGV